MTSPIIVTARLDPASFAVLDRLRGKHFPAALNKVPAHISLFHALPGDAIDQVQSDVETAVAGLAPLDLRRLPPRFLGHGVALAYEHEALTRLRATLAGLWSGWLTPQDRQPFKAHVTIQNKVEATTARVLYERLQSEEAPPCRVDGVALWFYRGGPWSPIAEIAFPKTDRFDRDQ